MILFNSKCHRLLAVSTWRVWWCKACSCGLLQSGTSGSPETVEVNESIISLLLKLHSHLSGNPDSYNPEEPSSSSNADQSVDSRIGDGPYFVAKLLQRISSLDSLCRYVFVTLIWYFCNLEELRLSCQKRSSVK